MSFVCHTHLSQTICQSLYKLYVSRVGVYVGSTDNPTEDISAQPTKDEKESEILDWKDPPANPFSTAASRKAPQRFECRPSFLISNVFRLQATRLLYFYQLLPFILPAVEAKCLVDL